MLFSMPAIKTAVMLSMSFSEAWMMVPFIFEFSTALRSALLASEVPYKGQNLVGMVHSSR